MFLSFVHPINASCRTEAYLITQDSDRELFSEYETDQYGIQYPSASALLGWVYFLYVIDSSSTENIDIFVCFERLLTLTRHDLQT